MDYRLLGPSDLDVLGSVAPEVFDHPIVPAAARAFLEDPRHVIAVAVEDGVVMGFVSAVVYLHPDSAAPEMWVNEVGVAPPHRRSGVASRLIELALDHARAAGCSEAWVLTDRSNAAANGLYRRTGAVADDGDTVMYSYRLDVGSSG